MPELGDDAMTDSRTYIEKQIISIIVNGRRCNVLCHYRRSLTRSSWRTVGSCVAKPITCFSLPVFPSTTPSPIPLPFHHPPFISSSTSYKKIEKWVSQQDKNRNTPHPSGTSLHQPESNPFLPQADAHICADSKGAVQAPLVPTARFKVLAGWRNPISFSLKRRT
jgi:hypothetical protein